MTTDAPSFGTPYSDTAMHDADDDAVSFDGATFTPSDEPLPPDDDENPFDQFLRADEPELNADWIEPKKRTGKAVTYERKVQGLFALGVKITIANPRTVADSAALLLHGPGIAEKAGDLAADNPKVAAIIDSITDQTANPATALIVASVPLVLQIMRNHESAVMEDVQARRTVKFMRWQLRAPRLRRLPKRVRNVTQDPLEMTQNVLTDTRVRDALSKQGINIVIG